MTTDSELDTAKFIVKQHSNKIKPGELHENNQAVIDWINNAKQIVKDNDSERVKRKTNAENKTK